MICLLMINTSTVKPILMKSDVCIVASGSCLKNSDLGEQIDDFENVIRFGGSEVHLETYKEDVGTKTTELIHNSNYRALLNFKQRLKDTPKLYAQIPKLCLTHKGMKRKRRLLVETTLNEYKQINNGTIRYLKTTHKYLNLLKRNNCTLLQKKASYTSGLCLILDSLRTYKNVYICGFDALRVEMKNNYFTHFYGGNAKFHRYGHDVNSEANIIKELIEKTGRLFELK